MKNDIKSGIKIFCCSNRNQKFFETIIRPIIDELKLSGEQYLIYSGDYGELIKKDNLGLDSLIIDEYKGSINTEDWNRPEILIIFYNSIYYIWFIL